MTIGGREKMGKKCTTSEGQDGRGQGKMRGWEDEGWLLVNRAADAAGNWMQGIGPVAEIFDEAEGKAFISHI